MKRYLENLQKKPDHHKRRFALGAASFITSIIFLIWLSVLLPNSTSSVVAQNETQESNGETPLAILRKSVAQVYTSIKGTMSKTQKSLDLQAEYDQMKNQVQNGEIEFAPDTPTDSSSGY